VLNYLARLGWSHGDQEIFSREELIAKFGWDHCGRTAGKYDAKKFAYVQAEHLRKLDDATLARHCAPFLARRGVDLAYDDPRLVAAIGTVKTRATTYVDAAEMVEFYFREPLELDPKAREKFLTPEAAPRLDALADLVEGTTPFSRAALEAKVMAWLAAQGLAMKDVAQPARVAMTGKTQSPGLFEVMEVLGETTTLARLRAGAALARGA
jgi:glutamyl-tRNA synthetase